jgi:hypothetical protein
MNLFEYHFILPHYTTGPGPNLRTAVPEVETVVAATIEESLLVFKRNKPGSTITCITNRGPALT